MSWILCIQVYLKQHRILPFLAGAPPGIDTIKPFICLSCIMNLRDVEYSLTVALHGKGSYCCTSAVQNLASVFDHRISCNFSCSFPQFIDWLLKFVTKFCRRDDSCFVCVGPNGEDISGGYFEAGGSYLKMAMPSAHTVFN